MSFVHLLLAAASLSAFAGGSWTVERSLDRFARIADEQPDMAEAAADEDQDPKILY